MKTIDLYAKDFLFELHSTPELYTFGVMLDLPGNYRLMEDIVLPFNPYLTYRFQVAIFMCSRNVHLNFNNKTIFLNGENQIAVYCIHCNGSSISHGETRYRQSAQNIKGCCVAQCDGFSLENLVFTSHENEPTMEEKRLFKCLYQKQLDSVLDWQEHGLYFILLDYLVCEVALAVDWFEDHQLMATQLLQSVAPAVVFL